MADLDYGEIGVDSLMPAQFWATRRRTALDGIQRLQMAVLEDAWRCIQWGADAKLAKRRRAAWEARLWFDGEWGDGPFACETICDSLGVDWSGLRRYVAAGCNARIPRRSATMTSLMRVEQPDRRVR